MVEARYPDPLAGLRGMFEGDDDVRERARLRLEALADAQRGALNEWEGLVHGWFSHRRDRTAAASGALRELCGCHDAGAAIGTYQRWLLGETGELARELAEAQVQGLRVMQAWGAAMHRAIAEIDKPPQSSERPRTRPRAADRSEAA